MATLPDPPLPLPATQWLARSRQCPRAHAPPMCLENAPRLHTPMYCCAAMKEFGRPGVALGPIAGRQAGGGAATISFSFFV